MNYPISTQDIFQACMNLRNEFRKKNVNRISLTKYLSSLNPELPPHCRPAHIDMTFNSKFNRTATTLENCGVLNALLKNGNTTIETLKVYLIGEYIHKNHGIVYQRDANGDLAIDKNNRLKVKSYPFKEIFKLDNMHLYKPESIRDQYKYIGHYLDEHKEYDTPFSLDKDQKNALWNLVTMGKLGFHLYLSQYKIHEGFNIDKSKCSPDYLVLIKIIEEYLEKDELNLYRIRFLNGSDFKFSI